jgi:hypothetical protein
VIIYFQEPAAVILADIVKAGRRDFEKINLKKKIYIYIYIYIYIFEF